MPTPPILKAPLILTSILLSSTYQITIIATMAFPSLFSWLSPSISSVVAISTSQMAHFGFQESTTISGPALPIPPAFNILSTTLSISPASIHQIATLATMTSPFVITLVCISSVVAISLLSTAHSDTAAVATSLGDQAPTPPTPNAPLIFASFPGTHTHHTTTTATTDIPSIFITLLSISSVVALSLFTVGSSTTPATQISPGHLRLFPPTLITPSTPDSTQLPALHLTMPATPTASPFALPFFQTGYTVPTFVFSDPC